MLFSLFTGLLTSLITLWPVTGAGDTTRLSVASSLQSARLEAPVQFIEGGVPGTGAARL
jgi:hypothetical protein